MTRPMSREVLARYEASQIAAAGMPNGTCVRRARLWSVLELAHGRARTSDEAAAVVAAVNEEFCGDCPARLGCAQLARTDRYSGLAAGAAYDDGVRRSPRWVKPKPGRRSRKAAS